MKFCEKSLLENSYVKVLYFVPQKGMKQLELHFDCQNIENSSMVEHASIKSMVRFKSSFQTNKDGKVSSHVMVT